MRDAKTRDYKKTIHKCVRKDVGGGGSQMTSKTKGPIYSYSSTQSRANVLDLLDP